MIPVSSPLRLASLCRYHRKRAKLTQIDLAFASDVSRKVIQDLEAGKDGISWGNLLAVLEVLNIELVPSGSLVEDWHADTTNQAES